MDAITRRHVLKLGLAAGATLVGGSETSAAKSPTDGLTPLADAVHAFNDRAIQIPFGKEQPPLTEEEVIAAIRWSDLHRKEPVTDEEYRALRRVADTRRLSQGAELEVLTGFEPNDSITFEAWSVRLRMPRQETGGTYAFPIRERMIGSRLIGEEERKVIHEWRKKEQERGGNGSLERAEWMRAYRQERARAAAIDQARRK